MAATCAPGGAHRGLREMSANSKIALAVAGGYMLGRTKKLRLAMTLAGMLAGKKVATNRQLLTQGAKLVENNPQLKQLQGQLTGRLVDVAREAALVAAASRVESFTQSLQSKGSDSRAEEDEHVPDEDSATEEAQEEQAQDDAGQDDGSAPRRGAAERSPDKAPARKSAASKAPAKKAPAKKAPAKRASAKKTSAQRSTAKKSPAGAGR
ncbi:hypothetical protein ACFFOS_00890 [Nocardioides kongjuensis]